jgi:hypothetical protein
MLVNEVRADEFHGDRRSIGILSVNGYHAAHSLDGGHGGGVRYAWLVVAGWLLVAG